MVRRNVDKSLSTFVLSLVQIVLYFILIVTVIGILGINTSSFIALFASAGVAIGMALSGTLQNFAGGVLILLLKPYRIGDFIEAQGFSGTVTEIQIFSTIICTADNKSIIIPNGGLSTGTINNWSREDYRRVEWTVSLSYGDDVATAKKAILDILESFDEIVKDDIASHRRRELD
ncbi:MAG: mechanosensitive ion channel family protein, partial [Paramuribaculum sp.]|nr:mechanosensitive ion channel family protein [Paramuribaculum sp.]